MLPGCNFSITRDCTARRTAWPSYSFSRQDAGVRGREREEWPTDTRARQEEQSLGRERQVHNHVIGARAEEGQQKKKEACIQTEEERSRSFIHGKRNLRQRSRRRGGGGVGGETHGRKRKTSAAIRSRFGDLPYRRSDRPPAPPK